MNGVVLDLRAGVRGLWRSPGYAAVAVLMLAVGIGASAAVFGIIRGVLLRPLAYPEPERLVWLCESNPRVGYCTTAPPNAYDWAARSASLEGVGVVRTWHHRVRRGEKVAGVNVAIMTPELFGVLRARPQLGRLLQPADQQGEGARVVVLSDEYWRTEFGADPGVVGSTLQLDGEAYEVVGVAPAGLVIPGAAGSPLMKPLHIDPRSEEHRDWRGFSAIGRVRDGVTLEALRAELGSVAAALARERPETNEGWGVQVEWLRDRVVGGARPMLLLFAVAVGVVPLVVCANAANLLLARSARRQHELAVRLASGAPRRRLVRQLVIETGLVAVAGALLGHGLAVWGATALLALAPRQLPRSSEIVLGWDVLGFGLALALLLTFVVGLVPALWASRTDVQTLLRSGDGRAGRGFGAGRASLVVAEVALSVMLLTAAGVLLRSLAHQLSWDPGFPRDGLVVTQVFPPAEKYDSEQALTAFYDRAKEALAAIPGVVQVGSGSAGPLFGGLDAFSYRVDGDVLGEPHSARAFDIDEHYLETLGLRVVRGRDLRRTDTEGTTRVALVNEQFARANWGESDPVGRRIRLMETDWELEVVGVVQDVASFPGDEAMNGPALYTSQRQAARGATFLVLRTATAPEPVLASIRATLLALEPDLTISTSATMAQRIDVYTAGARFNLLIVGLFAAAALLLAVAGLYGVIACATGQRTREFGIRLALGGRPLDVVRLVLGQAGWLVGAGVALGTLGAVASARLLQSLVVGVEVRDPAVYMGVMALLGAAGLAAAAGPAWAAVRRAQAPARLFR